MPHFRTRFRMIRWKGLEFFKKKEQHNMPYDCRPTMIVPTNTLCRKSPEVWCLVTKSAQEEPKPDMTTTVPTRSRVRRMNESLAWMPSSFKEAEIFCSLHCQQFWRARWRQKAPWDRTRTINRYSRGHDRHSRLVYRCSKIHYRQFYIDIAAPPWSS